MPPSKQPSSQNLRRLLGQVLPTDADLDAFCLDHFPRLKQRFSGSMDRLAKQTLLLELEPAADILDALRRTSPDVDALLAELEAQGGAPPRRGTAAAGPAEDGSDALPRSLATVLWGTLGTWRGLVRAALLLVGVGLVALTAPGRLGSSTGLALSGAALSLFCAGSLLHTLWLRWRIPNVTATRFVGPLPMEEKDAGRFYGREAKVLELQHKLAQPEVRHILLFGVSGCGKTSLLRAGLIPRLRDDFECVYLRFTDDPVGALRRELGAIAPARVPGPPAPTLLQELEQARHRAGRPILLCIDQFEEFQINPIGGEGFRQVRELIWAVSGSAAHVDAKLVLSLREDFLSLLTDFYQDKGFARGEEKVRIEPFEEDVAEEVIGRLLNSEAGGLLWDPTLVRRVLNDLVFQKLTLGEQRRYVMPTELQIVFQMVQSRRIRRAEDYPGKKKLLLDYIGEAIATVPAADPPLVKQLLLALIDANGQTKAKPQTLVQLAQQVQADAEKVRRVLLHLDLNRHVVRSFHPERTSHAVAGAGDPAGQTLHYELAHDYLAGVIRVIAGAEMSGAKRSQAILEMARLRVEHEPRYTIPLLDCWQLYRYPAEHVTPEDRALLRRSVTGFALHYCLPAAVLLLIVGFIRFGTCTVRLQYGHAAAQVVLSRGVATLQPILGAREASTLTGLQLSESDWYTLSGPQRLVRDLTDGVWLPSGLSFIDRRWDPDVYLRRRVVEAIRPYALPVGNECLYSQPGDRSFSYLLLATSEDTDREIAAYEESLRCGLTVYLKLCAATGQPSPACERQLDALDRVAEILSQLDLPGELEKLRSSVEQVIAMPDLSPAALAQLGQLWGRLLPTQPERQSAVERQLLQRLRQRVIASVAELGPRLAAQSPDVATTLVLVELIASLGQLYYHGDDPLSGYIGSPALVSAARDALLRALTVPTKVDKKRALLQGLVKLSGADPQVVGYLVAQLAGDDAPMQTASFFHLLALDPGSAVARAFLHRALTDTLAVLRRYDVDSLVPLTAESRHALNLFSGLLHSSERQERIGARLLGPGGGPPSLTADEYGELFKYYEKVRAMFREGVDQESASSFVMTANDYYSYQGLLMLWRAYHPHIDVAALLATVTEQQDQTRLDLVSYYDLRTAIFAHEAPDTSPDPLFDLLGADGPLRRSFESIIVEPRGSPELDCQWLALAVRYRVATQAISDKLARLQDDCVSYLPRAIARYRILGNPATVDAARLARLDDTLRQWLAGPESHRLRAYQEVLLGGYRFLYRLQDGQPGQAAWLSALRQRLLGELRRADTPLHDRLAASALLRDFR